MTYRYSRYVFFFLAVFWGLGTALAGTPDGPQYIHLPVEKIKNEADAFAKCEAARIKWLSSNRIYKTALWTGAVQKAPYDNKDICEIRYYGGEKDIAYIQPERIQWDKAFDATQKCQAAIDKWQSRHPEVKSVRWLKEWVTVEPGKIQVCLAEYSTRLPDSVLYHFYSGVRTGSLRQACEPARQEWQKNNSQYKTVLWTGHAQIGGYGTYTCEFRYSTQETDTAYIEAGTILPRDDPVQKCENALKRWQSKHPEISHAKWTQKWETNIPGKMAVCEVVYSTK